MIRNFEREQLIRLSAKTLDQVFVMRAKEGLGCSQFEAEALTKLIKEVYFPWLSQPEAIQAGQLAMTTVSADEPEHKPLSKCKTVSIVLTLYAGEEGHQYRLAQGAQGIAAHRQRQIVRLAHEALDQGTLLTAEDLAFRIFNCGLRTISRDLKALASQDVVHREQIFRSFRRPHLRLFQSGSSDPPDSPSSLCYRRSQPAESLLPVYLQ
jgi:hypothetical protein